MATAGYQANVEIVREAVLEAARAEYRVRAGRAIIDPEKFQVSPTDFATFVLPNGKTLAELHEAKKEAVTNLTAGVLNAAPGRVRAKSVQLAFDIAKKANGPVDPAKVDAVIKGILALG